MIVDKACGRSGHSKHELNKSEYLQLASGNCSILCGSALEDEVWRDRASKDKVIRL